MARIARISFVIALVFLVSALYIPVKAALAQTLLERAWGKTLTNGLSPKPWPWADTRPVARLRVPGYGIDQIVLAGDQGNSLAFGPGLHPASDLDEQYGMVVISGHRDTHFSFLKDIKPGEIIVLQTLNHNKTRYRVKEIHIVDTRQTQIHSPDNNKWLTLVTCYPFDTIRSEPSLRYVVMAEMARHHAVLHL